MNMPDKENGRGERDSRLPGALTEFGGFLACRAHLILWMTLWILKGYKSNYVLVLVRVIEL